MLNIDDYNAVFLPEQIYNKTKLILISPGMIMSTAVPCLKGHICNSCIVQEIA